MACDTWKSTPTQTLTERKEEIKKVIDLVAQAIVNGRVKPKVGPTGAIAFEGLDAAVNRRGVTDACVYRRIMSTGSAMAKQQLARAEQLAGRRVDAKALAGGHHSHDGGRTWHHGH
ncbi:hypothetical protein [Bradyrhizobium erythrophlei]|uniref:Uncharacterized protein n=1 Tax=Bradyrhizobium erythrophlei TaxID=1437360 RepID=A0A1M5NFY5_9BRAD|nr:hypothetical protein [Bradyrhizobium erythrophlei]SHG88129.1 hypothetical protein SAMN05443248_2970 [Bradyrhizobium erythrophlei]